MAENSSIIVCEQKFDVGRRVITYQEDPRISAYTPHCVTHDGVFPTSPAKGLGQMSNRYRGRRLIGADRSLGRLQQVLKQFVIHHDGMGTSRDCFRVLHDERGLSVHFLIDNNGDIYQTLDLVECAFQAAGVNETSIGVELCSRGDKVEPGSYPAELYKRYPREQVTCTVNGHQWLAWSYTKEQYESMFALARTLARIFPGLPQVCPQGADGEPLWATLEGDPREFAGYMGHYHVTNQKWDPGPWDFKKFIQNIRGRIFYPAVPGKDKAELPETSEGAEEIAHDLYDNNEKEGEGGYFPVGPVGFSRLWHGGLHLRDDRGKPIVSPFAGKIVLARNKKYDDWADVGSPNFVLIRHEMPLNGNQIKFFTLLMHLDEEEGEKRANWVKAGEAKKWWKDFANGDMVQPDASVAAGEMVGRFGEAGRKGKNAGAVHFEIFSEQEIGDLVQPGFWTTYDGTKGLTKPIQLRVCSVPDIFEVIDANKDRALNATEFVSFFHKNPAREKFRKIAVRHQSEWGNRNDFEQVLNMALDFKKMPRPAVHKLFTDQMEPFFWWNEGLAIDGLPAYMMVWGYHPITFVLWIHDQFAGKVQTAKGIGDQSTYSGKKPPAEIKDDAEATDGFMDDEDALFGEAAKSLDLEKLAAGYPE
jgi:hypothetical protein